MDLFDVIIIGGGLAGLTASIDLSEKGHKVLLIEKDKYPHHKVCGEYISNEIIPYLNKLGISLAKSIPIDTLQISNSQGKALETKLPLGGFGYSRYAFDYLLYKQALEVGVKVIRGLAQKITFVNTYFEVVLMDDERVNSRVVIGAYGKRSALDKEMNRAFAWQKAPWLGVKAHYHFPNFRDNVVGIHSFKGGYGGLSKVETGAVNFCYLTSYKSFQAYKSIAKFNDKVVSQNPILKEFLANAEPLMQKPLSIAQISFSRKKAVENHILMCGDTAGLIHPLCGNGMAMAIHSAQIVSKKIDRFLIDASFSRIRMEKEYQLEWNRMFKNRLRTGRILQSIFVKPFVSNLVLEIGKSSPKMVSRMIKKTHGKPIEI
ncbi:MAG: NAD(P)/FAD-dependent oxidoreductase [Eudoraea sp.]